MLHKTAATEVPKHPHANPVESASALLAYPKRQEHIKNIKTLLHLPPKLYDSLYYKVIERFAEFVQNMPETLHGIFGSSGGFLDHGLERASRALGLVLTNFFPEEKSFHTATSEQALWIYAVFTAGLLLDVGKLAVKHDVTLCNKDGSTLRDWLPYSGSMVGQGKYFKFTYVKLNRDNLRNLITGLLARQLLTEADSSGDGSTTIGGFNWIASNPVVLEAWLNMLRNDTRNVTSYLTVIPLADQQTITNYINNNKQQHQVSKNAAFGSGLFDTSNIDNVLNTIPDLAAATAFENWLRDKLNTNQLSINEENSLIHGIEEGVLLSERIFDQYSKDNPHVDLAITKTEFARKIELYNASFAGLGQAYAHLTGSTTMQKMIHWQAIHAAYWQNLLGQRPDVNANIVKITNQTQQAPYSLTPTEQLMHKPDVNFLFR